MACLQFFVFSSFTDITTLDVVLVFLSSTLKSGNLLITIHIYKIRRDWMTNCEQATSAFEQCVIDVQEKIRLLFVLDYSYLLNVVSKLFCMKHDNLSFHRQIRSPSCIER